jgi:hypothetical protein
MMMALQLWHVYQQSKGEAFVILSASRGAGVGSLLPVHVCMCI